MNHQVFEQHDETAFRCADGEKQIDHPNDGAIATKDEDPAATRLFENQTQAAELLVFVRAKIALLREESAEHLGQFIQIGLGSGLNDDFFAHVYCALHCLSQKVATLATRIKTAPPPAPIDNPLLILKVTALNSRGREFSVL